MSDHDYIVRVGMNIPVGDKELRLDPDDKLSKKAMDALKPAQIKQLVKDGIIEKEGD